MLNYIKHFYCKIIELAAQRKGTGFTSTQIEYNIDNAKYRNFFLSEKNRLQVEKSRQMDYEYILDCFSAEYKNYIDLFDDEYVENRYGLQKIIELLDYIERDKKILDVGCGNGELCIHLSKMGFPVYGLDASPHRVIRNRTRFKKIFFGFSENMPFDDGYFYIIICTECLEHVVSIDLTLKEISRCLSDSGKVMIQVPYKNLIESDNHVRLFSEVSLREVVEQYFNIIFVEIIPYLNGQEPNNIFLYAEKK